MALNSLLAWVRRTLEGIPKDFSYVGSLYIYCKACSNPTPILLSNVVYWEGKSFRLFLMLDIECKITYMVMVSDMNLVVADLVGDNLREHVLKFLVDGQEDELKKLIGRMQKTEPRFLLEILKEAENQKTLHVEDQHLYNYFKTLLTLNRII